MIEFVYGLASGILLGAISGIAGYSWGYAWKMRRSVRRQEVAPEFKLADDQDPIDPPRVPGETRVSKIDYRRQTATRRLVARSKPNKQEATE